MLIKKPADIRSSEITDRKLYYNRREFMRTATGTAVAVAAGAGVFGGAEALLNAAQPAAHGRKLEGVKPSPFGTNEKPNTWEQITTYNNYYEFGIDKDAPAEYARDFKTEPWTVAVEGECNKKAVLSPRGHAQGRDARGAHLPPPLRRGVVDGDSRGSASRWPTSSSGASRRRRRSTSSSRRSTTRADAGPAASVLDWPYVEGLRMDEAMHPLTILAVGLYGEVLPEPGRRADPAGRAVEVRLQAHQVDRQDPVRREAAAQHVAATRRRTNTASTRT